MLSYSEMTVLAALLLFLLALVRCTMKSSEQYQEIKIKL